jgi:spore coat protein U-like protein
MSQTSFFAHFTIVVAVTSLSTPTFAGTSTGSMLVSSLVVNACVVAATPLVFGTINLIGASPNDSTSTITVTCTPGTTFNVGLDNGSNFATNRRMRSATAAVYVPYGLFSDTGHATAWGTTIGTNTVAGTAVLSPTLMTVYGRIPGGTAAVVADAYVDSVAVTVTY